MADDAPHNNNGPRGWGKWLVVGAAAAAAGAMLLATAQLGQPQAVQQHELRGGPAEDVIEEPEESLSPLLHPALWRAANQRCSEATSEAELVEQLKRVMDEGGAALVAEEWMPVEKRTDMGKGDLVFRLGGVDFVVEAKYISLAPGPTSRRRRTHHRAFVRKQALRYAREWRDLNSGRRVVAVTFTNEQGWVELADD